MRIIVALFLTTGFFSQSVASPIYGLLRAADEKFFIVQEKQIFEITSNSVEVDRDLARLSSGDFVALEGYFNVSQRKVFVNSVDWVGLKRILGSWKTSDKKVVEFQDFTVLMLHNYEHSTFPINQVNTSRNRTQPIPMSYRMAPGVGSSWTLFLSDGKKLHMGRVNLSGHNLAITFFNIDTGKIIKTLKLSRQSSPFAFLLDEHL
ncbi:MAG: hypothetical protein SGJ18_09805 [Pseudomonadota bacterium]|nr:hypothetical protein [Pseudomonadota bacterium]